MEDLKEQLERITDAIEKLGPSESAE
jgi:hypothetical protein